MPRLMIRCGAVPAISAPSNSIEPAVGASVPESMLKIVLLPEPFGPIRPRISPSSTWNETLATAVKPPKRLTSPLTSSTRARSLRRVRRGGRQLQHRLALLLRLRPDDVALIVDVLHDDREGALVLAGHSLARLLEFDAKAEHRRAIRQVGVERRLTQRIRIDAAVFLDRTRQHLG